MAMTLGGTNPAVTFPDGTIQNTAAVNGKVLQVVQGNLNSTFTTTSTSYVDTGITVNITPLFSTSKILVIVSVSGSSTNTSIYGINRNGTYINTSTAGSNNGSFALCAGNGGFMYPIGTSYLDSPATTSVLTYKIQVKCDAGTSNINTRVSAADNGSTSSITLMEIAA